MNARKFGLSLACAMVLSGCAAENLQRTDTINSFAGDSAARNIAIQTINPTPNRARDRHLHFNGTRLNDAMKTYETPSKAAPSKVKGTALGKL